jgi:phosphatidylglycerol:prolipoprotein diacylglycerol transferase
MRPRIVDYFISLSGSTWIKYFIPTGFTIYVIAVLVVWLVMMVRAKEIGLPPRTTFKVIAVAVLCGIIGARLFFLFAHVESLWAKPKLLLNLRGGTVSWGAYLFGFLGFAIYLKYHGLSIKKYADLLGASLGLGPFIGRWACFINGCCYGTITSVPWAVRFPKYSHAYNAHWKAGLLNLNETLSLAVHPVQLYSSLAALILFFVMTKLWKRYLNKSGMTIAFYALLYGLIRFQIEFFRGDAERYSIMNLTLSQFICIILFCSSLLALFILQKRYRIPRDKGKTSIS